MTKTAHLNRFLGDTCVVLVGLVLAIFITFHMCESGDMGVVVLGTALYVPYAIVLAVYDTASQVALRRWGRRGAGTILLPLVPLVLWVLLAQGNIEVRYWRMDYVASLIAIGLLGALNALNHFRHLRTAHGSNQVRA